MRKIVRTVTGYQTQDGAGVKLVRVLGNQTATDYDPFLMLDSFDSYDPADYIKGFPMHPHRGIETITFLSKGAITHEDSLGNKDIIEAQEVQWMTAGSGILHEEMPQARERMLGVQIWLNLPEKDKMAQPEYHSLRKDDIKEFDVASGKVRLIAGRYENEVGFQPRYQKVNFYDILLENSQPLSISDDHEMALIFLLEGNVLVNNEEIKEKTAVLLTGGSEVCLQSDQKAEVLYLSGDRLNESIAWGGPIVMNQQEELNQAFLELQTGSFIKHKPKL